MRDYAKVSPQFWTRGSGKRLRGDADAQVLALYLVTCPHANMIGIYYVPFVAISHETGLGEARSRAAMARLAAAGFADYDAEAELAWVPNMAAYQIGESVSPKDNRHKSILGELSKHSGHRFLDLFLERYGCSYSVAVRTKPLGSPLEAPWKPLGSPSEGSSAAWRRAGAGAGEEQEMVGFEKPPVYDTPPHTVDEEPETSAIQPTGLLFPDANPSHKVPTDPTSPKKATNGSRPTSDESAVYEHWVAAWKRLVNGKRTPNLSPERLRKLRARLDDGYDVDDLKTAIDGAFASPFHNGTEQPKRYIDLELIFRDEKHTDQFIDLAETLCPKPRTAPARRAPDEPEGPAMTEDDARALYDTLESLTDDPLGDLLGDMGAAS